MILGNETGYKVTLRNGRGISESLRDLGDDVYDILNGCAFNAEDIADALNRAHKARRIYCGNWFARRSDDAVAVVEGVDYCDNRKLLTVAVDDGGETVHLSLAGRDGYALSLENIVMSGSNREDLIDYILEVDEWDSDAYAEALDRAYEDGVLSSGHWHGIETGDEKCKCAGEDYCGNISVLSIWWE